MRTVFIKDLCKKSALEIGPKNLGFFYGKDSGTDGKWPLRAEGPPPSLRAYRNRFFLECKKRKKRMFSPHILIGCPPPSGRVRGPPYMGVPSPSLRSDPTRKGSFREVLRPSRMSSCARRYKGPSPLIQQTTHRSPL